MIAQCLAGLQAAHALGLVHRDVKPGNILLDRPSGRAMLVDFGLVRRLNQSAAMTATGVIMGTVDYIAPEQARGFPVDGRTDIYSAGVLLYQLLSGRMPFTADTPTAMVFQHAYEKPFPLDEAMPGLPLSVRQIVERMMAKDPSRRYADCAAVLADIAAYGEGRPLSPAPQPAESGSVADDELAEVPELPPQLANWLATGRWRRVQDWAATMFRRHAPQYVQEMQSTTRQMDAAVAQYQRRRNRLASLCHEAGAILDALAEQIQANREAAAAAASHADAADSEDEKEAARARQLECEEHLVALELQHERQGRQFEDLEMQLSEADATLARLRSQQDLLKARLQTAEARRQLAGVSRRRPRLLSRPWVLAVVVTIFVGIVSTQLLIQRAKRLSRPVNTSGMESFGEQQEETPAVPPPSPPPPPAVLIGGSAFRGPPRFRQSYVIITASFEEGYLFRTAIGGELSPERIDAPLSRPGGWGNDSVEFSIRSDAAGQPGMKLATFAASGIAKGARIYSATRSSPPCTLAGGAEYWLVASTAKGEVNWRLEVNAVTGKYARRTTSEGGNKDSWHVFFPAANVPAFSIYGPRVPQAAKREMPAAKPTLGPNMIIGGSTLRSPPQFMSGGCVFIRSTFEEGYLFHTASGGEWIPERIEAPLACPWQKGSDKVDFSIWSDATGQPGAKLATFTVSGITYATSLCSAMRSSPSCRLAGDSPYWLIASAPQGTASWNMDTGVYNQTLAMRPAGSKEKWLVRKAGNMPAFTIYGSPASEAAKQRPVLDRADWFGDPHKVVEGVGWGAFRVGAIRSELVKAYGPPSQNFDPREPSLHWRKQHIYCLIDSVRGASRLRFGKGFEIPLASGVRIGSPESQVLSAYGTATQVLEKGPEKTLEYPSRGVEFLLTHGVVSEFSVFWPRGVGLTHVYPPSQQMKEWAKANSRMARDASLFSQKELTEVQWLALVADQRLGSDEAWKAAKTLLQKYPKSSRTGGALIRLSQMSHGEEKIAYLKQAIADYSDCYLIDGVQVGAYARFLLGRAYLDSGESEKAKRFSRKFAKTIPTRSITTAHCLRGS